MGGGRGAGSDGDVMTGRDAEQKSFRDVAELPLFASSNAASHEIVMRPFAVGATV